MPREHEGEQYLTAIEAAKYLGISREKFYKNVKDRLEQHEIGAWSRAYYKQSDLDKLKSKHIKYSPYSEQ